MDHHQARNETLSSIELVTLPPIVLPPMTLQIGDPALISRFRMKMVSP